MAREPKIFTSSLFRDCNQMIWQNWKIVSLHYMPCSGMSWQKNGSILWIVTSSHCDYFLIMSTSQKTNLKSKWIFRIFTHLQVEKNLVLSRSMKNTPWLWFIFPIKWGEIIWLICISSFWRDRGTTIYICLAATSWMVHSFLIKVVYTYI